MIDFPTCAPSTVAASPPSANCRIAGLLSRCRAGSRPPTTVPSTSSRSSPAGPTPSTSPSTGAPSTTDRSSGEDVEEPLGGAGDHGPAVADDDRTLHEDRMLEQQVDDLLTGLVRGLVETELGEALVLAHQFGRGIVEHVEHAIEIGPGQRVVEV